ncbi:MAG: SAM-dependent methyltransferase, partial [Rhodospirillales bacterium]|nr:SAM-dependent methyltransferase [Rhodospirillales bacterium]
LESAGLSSPPKWHQDFDEIPDGPVLLVANEFLDALPIRQFQKNEGGWQERMVTIDLDDQLTFGLGPFMRKPPLLTKNVLRAPAGSVAEVSSAAISLIHAIGTMLRRSGGCALIVDYGYAMSQPGDTLQAARNHRHVAVLDDPGGCDLTSHVDFAALIRAATETGSVTFGPLPQGTFLRRLGLTQRIDALAAGSSPDLAAEMKIAGDRLISARHMGDLFKVLAIQHPDFPVPPAFE